MSTNNGFAQKKDLKEINRRSTPDGTFSILGQALRGLSLQGSVVVSKEREVAGIGLDGSDTLSQSQISSAADLMGGI